MSERGGVLVPYREGFDVPDKSTFLWYILGVSSIRL